MLKNFGTQKNCYQQKLALQVSRFHSVELKTGERDYENHRHITELEFSVFIIGSSQYSMSDVREYLEFLSGNEMLQNNIKSLAALYKVEEINKAFADIKARKNIKSVLVSDKND